MGAPRDHVEGGRRARGRDQGVSREQRQQATDEAERNAANVPDQRNPVDFLPQVEQRHVDQEEGPHVDVVDLASSDSAAEDSEDLNDFDILHWDCQKGTSYNLPPDYKLKTDHDVRRAVSLWLNGNTAQRMAPYQMFKRKKISDVKSQKSLWDLWKRFFDTMQHDVLKIESYPCGTKRKRVHEKVVDEITTKITEGLQRPPYEFIRMTRPRVRRGGITEMQSEEREGVPCIDTGLAIGTIGKMLRCKVIWDNGTEDDVLHMQVEGGCTRGCKTCTAEMAKVVTAMHE